MYVYHKNRTDKTTTSMKIWLIAFFRPLYMKGEREIQFTCHKNTTTANAYIHIEQKKEKKDETRSTYIYIHFLLCTVDMSRETIDV